MIPQLTKKCFPPAGAATADFRVSGVIFLIGALFLAVLLVVTLASLGMFQLMPISMLPVFIVWFMGVHRLLWGGTSAQTRGLGAARAALTGCVGFVSLGVISGLVGFLFGLLHRGT